MIHAPMFRPAFRHTRGGVVAVVQQWCTCGELVETWSGCVEAETIIEEHNAHRAEATLVAEVEAHLRRTVGA